MSCCELFISLIDDELGERLKRSLGGRCENSRVVEFLDHFARFPRFFSALRNSTSNPDSQPKVLCNIARESFSRQVSRPRNCPLRSRSFRGNMRLLRYREDVLGTEGKFQRRHRAVVLGPVLELSLREAGRLAEQILRPINAGCWRPQSLLTLGNFYRQQ